MSLSMSEVTEGQSEQSVEQNTAAKRLSEIVESSKDPYGDLKKFATSIAEDVRDSDEKSQKGKDPTLIPTFRRALGYMVVTADPTAPRQDVYRDVNSVLEDAIGGGEIRKVRGKLGSNYEVDVRNVTQTEKDILSLDNERIDALKLTNPAYSKKLNDERDVYNKLRAVASVKSRLTSN